MQELVSANIHQNNFIHSFIIQIKHFFFCKLIYVLSQDYSKFQSKMILYLASKSTISASALLPRSICYMLHKTFLCGKIRKLLVYLIKFSNSNQYLLVIDAKYCSFRNLTTTFQHPHLFFYYNDAVDSAQRSVRNVYECTLLHKLYCLCLHIFSF